MGNSLLTPSVIAKEALIQLENNMVAANLVHRAYEDEYSRPVNGNRIGSSVTIRKPVRYTVRDGAVAQSQDTVESYTSITIDKQKGVDLSFTSQQLTLEINEFGERYLKPAMSQLANQVDMDLLDLYKDVPNWVGTPGQTIDSWADFSRAPERMDEFSVPVGDRKAILSPSDYWGTTGSLTSLFAGGGKTAETALRKASLGEMSDVDTYKAQNVRTLVTGTRDNTTPLIRGSSNVRTFGPGTAAGGLATDYMDGVGTNTALVKDQTGTRQTLSTDGWDASATLKTGEIFTIAGVFAVNPVSKQQLPFLRQFVVCSDVTANGTPANETVITISPAIITSGPYQTVSAAPADNAVITVLDGAAASQVHRQNLFFHKNAFGLVMVPMELPEGAVRAARESYEGLSIRVVPYYDGTNDISNWRFDILYGVKSLYPELAVRASG